MNFFQKILKTVTFGAYDPEKKFKQNVLEEGKSKLEEKEMQPKEFESYGEMEFPALGEELEKSSKGAVVSDPVKVYRTYKRADSGEVDLNSIEKSQAKSREELKDVYEKSKEPGGEKYKEMLERMHLSSEQIERYLGNSEEKLTEKEIQPTELKNIDKKKNSNIKPSKDGPSEAER